MSRYQKHQERIRIRPQVSQTRGPRDFFLHEKVEDSCRPGTCGECVFFSRNPGASAGQCDQCYQDKHVVGTNKACEMGEKKKIQHRIKGGLD